jgi:hypothetical protein
MAFLVNLAVEDLLSEVALRVILHRVRPDMTVGICYSRHGSGYLKKAIGGFNNAARGVPFIVLTDLDREDCAPAKVRRWLAAPRHPNLIFRVAVREVEAWVMADRSSFAQYISIASHHIPADPDSVPDPKQLLVNLARKSRFRHMRDAIVPRPGSTAAVGPDYNDTLARFLVTTWDVDAATRHSLSLSRAVSAIRSFIPQS